VLARKAAATPARPRWKVRRSPRWHRYQLRPSYPFFRPRWASPGGVAAAGCHRGRRPCASATGGPRSGCLVQTTSAFRLSGCSDLAASLLRHRFRLRPPEPADTNYAEFAGSPTAPVASGVAAPAAVGSGPSWPAGRSEGYWNAGSSMLGHSPPGGAVESGRRVVEPLYATDRPCAQRRAADPLRLPGFTNP